MSDPNKTNSDVRERLCFYNFHKVPEYDKENSSNGGYENVLAPRKGQNNRLFSHRKQSLSIIHCSREKINTSICQYKGMTKKLVNKDSKNDIYLSLIDSKVSSGPPTPSSPDSCITATTSASCCQTSSSSQATSDDSGGLSLYSQQKSNLDKVPLNEIMLDYVENSKYNDIQTNEYQDSIYEAGFSEPQDDYTITSHLLLNEDTSNDFKPQNKSKVNRKFEKFSTVDRLSGNLKKSSTVFHSTGAIPKLRHSSGDEKTRLSLV